MIREATEDTILTVPNPPGEDGFTTIPVQKGAQVIMALLLQQNLLTGFQLVVDMVGVRECF